MNEDTTYNRPHLNDRSGSTSYQHKSKWLKIKRKITTVVVNAIEGTPLQYKLYKSYWYYRLNKALNKHPEDRDGKSTQYICASPNYGAGIGHQLANWNAGFYFAHYYGLRFAHIPFSSPDWEKFLGFGEGEVSADSLKKNKYKRVGLPRFNSLNDKEVELIGKIIDSYNQKHILFCMEIDQGYSDQYGTVSELSRKFFSASSRSHDKIFFKPGHFNIAVHIRRPSLRDVGENLSSRWMDNSYYLNILSTLLDNLSLEKEISIYLFAQGEKDEFLEFNKFNNINYCLTTGPIESFLHMALADILISSKSSFSYKPALISRGLKICPKSFWHGYPPTDDFLLAEDNGSFEKAAFSRFMEINFYNKN